MLGLGGWVISSRTCWWLEQLEIKCDWANSIHLTQCPQLCRPATLQATVVWYLGWNQWGFGELKKVEEPREWRIPCLEAQLDTMIRKHADIIGIQFLDVFNLFATVKFLEKYIK